MSCRSAVRAAALAAALLATPGVAQVVDFGKYPNFKGQWPRPVGNPNNWIPLAGPPPLTPEDHKLWENNQADDDAGGPGNERIYLDNVAANTLYDQITVFDHSLARPSCKARKLSALQIPARCGARMFAHKTIFMSASRARNIIAVQMAS